MSEYYMVHKDTMTAIANAIREVEGGDETFTPVKMAEKVTNILEGTTYLIVDDEGNEYPAVYTDSEVLWDATPNDIRAGKIAVTGEGVITGTKEIPSYNTTEGIKYVTAGSAATLTNLTNCEFTKLQVIVCEFNSTLTDSVAATRVCIDGNIYDVNSIDVIATATADPVNNMIDLGFINDGDAPMVIRYFTYKEIY